MSHFRTSSTDFSDSLVLYDPSPTSVAQHIRTNFEEFVTGSKSRVVVLLREPGIRTTECARAMRDLIMQMGFHVRISTMRYVLLERSFRGPLSLEGAP
jgi:hypothetical protein